MNPCFEAKIGTYPHRDPSGVADANYFEPFFDQILAHFSHLMDVFQAEEEEE